MTQAGFAPTSTISGTSTQDLRRSGPRCPTARKRMRSISRNKALLAISELAAIALLRAENTASGQDE